MKIERKEKYTHERKQKKKNKHKKNTNPIARQYIECLPKSKTQDSSNSNERENVML